MAFIFRSSLEAINRNESLTILLKDSLNKIILYIIKIKEIKFYNFCFWAIGVIKFVYDWNSPADQNSPVSQKLCPNLESCNTFQVGSGLEKLVFFSCFAYLYGFHFSLNSISSATNSKNLPITIRPMLWWMEWIKGFCMLLCIAATFTLRTFLMFLHHPSWKN